LTIIGWELIVDSIGVRWDERVGVWKRREEIGRMLEACWRTSEMAWRKIGKYRGGGSVIVGVAGGASWDTGRRGSASGAVERLS
jgi:hypothetical protein